MKHLLFALVFAATPAVAQAPASDPVAAVNAFYAVYAPQRPHGGGIPDATERLRFQPVLTPRLNKQLADAARAQVRLTAKVKNAVPPMLEGDIFSSLFEGATAWKVGACQQTGQGNNQAARCTVALSYTPPPPPAGRKPEKPANWNDTVVLAMTPQGWKVDDIVYDAGFPFGNTGRLSGMLGMVIASNP